MCLKVSLQSSDRYFLKKVLSNHQLDHSLGLGKKIITTNFLLPGDYGHLLIHPIVRALIKSVVQLAIFGKAVASMQYRAANIYFFLLKGRVT